MVDDAVDHVENAVEITKDISASTYEKTHEAVGIISDQAVDVYQKVKAKTLDGIDWAEDGLDKISKSFPVILLVILCLDEQIDMNLNAETWEKLSGPMKQKYAELSVYAGMGDVSLDIKSGKDLVCYRLQ